MLAQSKRLNYMEGNLNAYLFDESKLNKEIRLLSWLRNNWGWLFLKKDQSIGQLDTSLTDFDAVTMLGYQIVSAISGVIAPRLLETSPKGLQSNGSYEEDSYKKMQQGIQRLDLHRYWIFITDYLQKANTILITVTALYLTQLTRRLKRNLRKQEKSIHVRI